MGKLKLIIEALLFTTERPLKAAEIHALLPKETLSNIKQALKELLDDYESMERSFTLKEVAEGYQIRSRQEYSPYILRMLRTSPAKLSRASFETLAIIAYKQPILRQEIERLRGVDSGGILRTLMEKGLIRIMGRKNLPGRPLIYGTTKRFLEVFDLKDLESLPKLKEIKDLGADEEQIEQATEKKDPTESPGEAKSPEGAGEAIPEPGPPQTATIISQN